MAVVSLPDLNKLKRILIIRLSSIGDVVHALPVAAALKDAYPHLELTWVVEEMSAGIVLNSPCLHEVIVIPRNRWKKQGRLTSPSVWREYAALLKTIRDRRFDMCLDLQGYAKSALLALASRAPNRFGWYRMRDGASLVSRPLPRRAESVHRVDMFLDVARAMNAGGAPVRFPLGIPEPARDQVRSLLAEQGVRAGERYVVINPSVGSPTRKWPAASYGELAARVRKDLGQAVVLIGSSKDTAICNEVRSVAVGSGTQSEAGPGIADLSGRTDIKELAAVLEGCSAHVCGDTGSAHIAAALGRPVVALYGPTDPALAGPWAQSHNVLAHRSFCAAQCGVRHCATAEAANSIVARCLSEISPNEVLAKVTQVIHDGS